MKEKKTKSEEESRRKKQKKKLEKKHRKHESSDSEEEQWVEKPKTTHEDPSKRDDWMAMSGIIQTYSKNDLREEKKQKDKQHIDSYNPGTSARELNPYWKDGGSGLPSNPETFRSSRPFVKPSDDDDFYGRKSNKGSYKPQDDDEYYDKSKNRNYHSERDSYNSSRSHCSSNWKRGSEIKTALEDSEKSKDNRCYEQSPPPQTKVVEHPSASNAGKYLSDEKMNKLGAKIVKAEIMGDIKLVNELKLKLEEAREYRKQNPDAGEDTEPEDIMLMATSSKGDSRPLTRTSQSGDPRSKGGKRKAETHFGGERTKYFGDDDKYSLNQMFEQEKYSNNFDEEAQLARVAGKHKNPNDDLEDIFTDEISKNVNAGKEDERNKQRAIHEHKTLAKSLDGCEYCVGSKNMLKHLMVSCGTKVYLAVPAKKSLVKGHCIITTIQHVSSVTALDEDVWEEVMDYRRALTKFFDSRNEDVVFFELAVRLYKYPHLVINCVPMPRDVGDVAAIYFKKALLECEAEWSMNKKVIDLKGKNVRRGVPKGLPYFWVDFGMDPGFAHVIEDQQLFPKTFAEEIIGGILDLDHNLWKNPQKEYGDHQRKKVLDFVQAWKKFDTVAKG